MYQGPHKVRLGGGDYLQSGSNHKQFSYIQEGQTFYSLLLRYIDHAISHTVNILIFDFWLTS